MRTKGSNEYVARLFAENETGEVNDLDSGAELLSHFCGVVSNGLIGVLHVSLLGQNVFLVELLKTTGSDLLLDVLGLAGLSSLCLVDLHLVSCIAISRP